jgi:hypothetical protein
MIITITWETEYRPSGWSFGYCESCQQEGAVRLEDMVEVCYLWGLFRMDEKPLDDTIARCDFCHRRVKSVRDYEGIDLDEWSGLEGVPALLAKLGVEAINALPKTTSDERLLSLLSSVQKASSLHKVDLSPIGVVVGAVAGLLAAIPAGIWLYEEQNVRIGRGETGTVMAMCMLGLVVGMILGATVETLLRRDSRPFSMIAETHAKYRLDLDRLEELSQSCSRRVRKAVKQVCAKESHRSG